MKDSIARVPGYVWTLIALASGIILGGMFSDGLEPVAGGTKIGLKWFIKLVPLIIIFALAPAISKLTMMGKGGKLAGTVVLWYLATSVAAGAVGLLISSIFFDIEFSSSGEGLTSKAVEMFTTLNGEAGASLPLLAILVAIVLGLAAPRISSLQRLLNIFDKGMSNSAPLLSIVMPFVVFFLGITLGVNIGATDSLKLYGLMTLYTFGLCFVWTLLYLFLVLKLWAKQRIVKVLSVYYLPTAVFAAGVCSSLATLPVNLVNVKRYGVSAPIANFVLPIGSVINLDTSALAYVAYAPFILSVVYGLPVSAEALIVAWPAVVLFTIAAPGLPAGMGTALWSSTLFAALLGLRGDEQIQFITTWVALSGGIPDMFRTATNCTGDGFTAILFNKLFGEQTGSDGESLTTPS